MCIILLDMQVNFHDVMLYTRKYPRQIHASYISHTLSLSKLNM